MAAAEESAGRRDQATAEDIRYVRHHGLVHLFDSFVQHLLDNKPQRPVAALVRFAQRGSSFRRQYPAPLSATNSLRNVPGGCADTPADRHPSRSPVAWDHPDPVVPPPGLFGDAGKSNKRRSLMLQGPPQLQGPRVSLGGSDGVVRRCVPEGGGAERPQLVSGASFSFNEGLIEDCDDDVYSPPSAMLKPGGGKRFGALQGLGASINVDEEVDHCREKGGENMDLHGMRLTEIPGSALKLHSLVSLELSSNSISEVPSDIANLVSLRTLSLKSNSVTRLPDEVGQLAALTHLYLDHNCLTEVPETLGNLQQLEVVGLDWNDLERFPVQLCRCPRLSRLYLVENPEITVLPPVAELRKWRAAEVQLDNTPTMVSQWAAVAEELAEAVTVKWNQVYPDRIHGNLFLGSLRSAQLPRVYADLGISHVASIGRELTVVLSPGMDQMQVNVDDLAETDLLPLLGEAHDYIDTALSSGTGCLVHCFKGQSRSATVVITYLMKKLGLTRDAAFKLVAERRPCINPNPGFMELMLRFEESLGLQGGAQ
eukprot:TRINITY_DN23961_c0_g1_i1.p1 TRINITY_DN23961_c0_g1~~TRINITY_DN23961_c0_g1_i1.p1  ORF type:complete len:575 (+),score=219.24 TRINITY_DN23961_c0_g1_i1:107-1726(+)